MRAADGIDAADVQGDILRAYGLAYEYTSYWFVHVDDPEDGRRWLRELVGEVTTATPWLDGKPASTLNLAITCVGLSALGVPEEVIGTFSAEFRDGMAARAALLGDVGPSAPDQWDRGLGRGEAHVLVTVNGLTATDLADRMASLEGGLGRAGLSVVHRQDARLLPGAREQFGFADGFSQPALAGVAGGRVRGGGVPEQGGRWRALAVGEFILAHPDEESRDDPARPPSAPADPLGRNGTYMVWRKLHQDVALFRRTVRAAARYYEQGDEEKLAAKIVGRWRNGSPLIKAPDAPDPNFDAQAETGNDFRYGADPRGVRCPLGAHIRRSNPRDALGFDGSLTFRHRMIRRGMPYGDPLPADALDDDGRDRGLIFVSFAASISRQFESVQVQWLNDGNIFHLGHDRDFLLGAPAGKMTVQGEPPFFLAPQRPFVATRGGEYLFAPGIAALTAIADGMAG